MANEGAADGRQAEASVSEFAWIIVLALFVIWFWNSVYRIKEGERGVVTRLGRILPEPKLPGLRLAYWPIAMMYRVCVEPQTLTIAPQELVARGDAEIKAGATCTFRVVDAGRVFAEVVDYRWALEKLARERMLQTVGQFSIEELLYAPAAMNEQIRQSLEETAREWGLEILSFELECESR
jgi:regulator of protease activity HflC (stomatin/prohibitin superfamily)